MELKIIKLKFKSPIHIGELGIGLEKASPIIHSDTIFGALCNSWSILYGEDETTDFLKSLKKTTTFRISSAFPFKDSVLFFPKPRTRFNDSGLDENAKRDYIKDIKNVDFLPQIHFENWLNQKPFTTEEINKFIVRSEHEKQYKCHEYQLPKVTVDRLGRSSSFYYVGLIQFEESAGLWFALNYENGVYKKWIIPGLRLLQDEGIGGKRSWGYGLFEFEEDDIDLETPESDYRMLLSLFYPRDDEKTLFTEEYASWEFVRRGGFIYSKSARKEVRKPRMKLITEGSIFEKEPEGQILEFENLRKDVGHSIYHYGLGLSIPIKINKEKDE